MTAKPTADVRRARAIGDAKCDKLLRQSARLSLDLDEARRLARFVEAQRDELAQQVDRLLHQIEDSRPKVAVCRHGVSLDWHCNECSDSGDTARSARSEPR